MRLLKTRFMIFLMSCVLFILSCDNKTAERPKENVNFQCLATSSASSFSVNEEEFSTNSLDVTAAGPSVTITVNSSATSTTVTLGDTITIASTPSGGTGTYTKYSYSNVPCAGPPPITQSFSCVTNAVGPFLISATVTDSSPSTSGQSNTVNLQVNTPPSTLNAQLTASPNPVIAGSGYVHIVTTANSGTPGYTYQYANLPTECGTQTSKDFYCQVTQKGTYNITVTVKDNSTPQLSTTASTILTVVESGSGTSAFGTTSTVTPNPVNAGETFTVRTSGSTPSVPYDLFVTKDNPLYHLLAYSSAPPYYFFYSGLPPDCDQKSLTSYTCGTISSVLTCRSQYPGTYNIIVTVLDGNWASSTSTVSLTIR